jgi:hypothetical protein
LVCVRFSRRGGVAECLSSSLSAKVGDGVSNVE